MHRLQQLTESSTRRELMVFSSFGRWVGLRPRIFPVFCHANFEARSPPGNSLAPLLDERSQVSLTLIAPHSSTRREVTSTFSSLRLFLVPGVLMMCEQAAIASVQAQNLLLSTYSFSFGHGESDNRNPKDHAAICCIFNLSSRTFGRIRECWSPLMHELQLFLWSSHL